MSDFYLLVDSTTVDIIVNCLEVEAQNKIDDDD